MSQRLKKGKTKEVLKKISDHKNDETCDHDTENGKYLQKCGDESGRCCGGGCCKDEKK